LAITSFLVSIGVCVVAAVQAELPADRERVWSRPLVACLFFLQPIVRGWARYKTHLALEPRSLSGEATATGGTGDTWAADEFFYWSQQGITRVEFIAKLVAALEHEKWPHKPDTGWNDYDLEVFGNRWSRVQVTGATEELGGNNRIFRWRICGYWSLAAKLAFWGLFGFETLVVGVISREQPWLWMLLLTIPLFGLFLEMTKRNLQHLVSALLDKVATQQSMKRLESREADDELALRH
jgi:hypothetical protein